MLSLFKLNDCDRDSCTCRTITVAFQMLQVWAHHCGAMVCNHVPWKTEVFLLTTAVSLMSFFLWQIQIMFFLCQIFKNTVDVENDLAYKVSLCLKRFAIFRLLIANVTWSDGKGKARRLLMRAWYCQWILGQFGTICANIWCQQQTRVCLLSVMQSWNLHFFSLHREIQIEW